jgi:hypothetical protein
MEIYSVLDCSSIRIFSLKLSVSRRWIGGFQPPFQAHIKCEKYILIL